MPNLPSKYSDEGLTERDSRRTITTGIRRSSGPHSLEFKVKQLSKVDPKQQEQQDEDVVMIGSDDFREVEMITKVANTQRQKYDQQEDIPISILDRSISSPPSQKLIFLVIDTNFILSHLDILDNLIKLYKKYGSSYQLIIPRMTIQELDGLKNNRNDRNSDDGIISNHSISQLARWANDWCFRHLASSNPLIRGQKFNERLDPSAKKDESILDCCLFLQEKFPTHLVILLSNDKNFCVKLLTNGVLTISYRPGMSADLIVKTIILENVNRGNALIWKDDESNQMNIAAHSREEQRQQQQQLAEEEEEEIDAMEVENDFKPIFVALNKPNPQYLVQIPDLETGISIIYDEVQKLVISLVGKIMFEEYGEDLEIMRYETPTNLHDVCVLIINNWVLIFRDKIQSVNFKQNFSHNGRIKSVAIADYIDVPVGRHSLSVFVEFWKQILEELYTEKSQRDNDALKLFFKRWDNIIEQVR